jgi:carbonic anhydrase
VKGGEGATIEYAVMALGIRDIIICGHSHCGATHGLLHQEELAMPSVADWL